MIVVTYLVYKEKKSVLLSSSPVPDYQTNHGTISGYIYNLYYTKHTVKLGYNDQGYNEQNELLGLVQHVLTEDLHGYNE